MMISLLAFLCALGQPGSSQSDWAGGPGFPGPLFNGYDNGFDDSEGIDWAGVSGSLTLSCDNDIDSVTEAFNGQKAGIAASDVDGDGLMDIVFGTTDPDGLGWFENPGSGAEWTRHDTSNDAVTSVESCDIDGDGDQDVLCSRAEAQVIAWYENAGAGPWTAHVIATGLGGACCAVPYDFEGDGDIDVAACGFLSGIVWYENTDGSGTSWNAQTISMSHDIWWIDAYNGDSDVTPEIYGIENGADRKYVFLWNQVSGGSWHSGTIDWEIGYDYYQVRVCDIDGDDQEDVLVGRSSHNPPYPDWGDQLSWYEYKTYDWEERTVFDAGNDGHLFDGFEPADLDGDGTTDLVAWSFEGQNVTAMFNVEGDGLTWLPRSALSGFSGQHACCADFDSDGMVEIAGALCDQAAGSIQLAGLPWDTHPASGTLESSIVQVPVGTDSYVEWGDLTWDGWAPESGSIAFQVRASADPEDMGTWSDPMTVNPTPLSGILPDDGEFLQYRVLFSAPAGTYSPVLDQVEIAGWVPGGIEGSDTHDILSVSAQSNPSESRTQLRLSTPNCERAVLSIFDMAGRLVERSDLGPLIEGTTMFTTQGQAAGIYHALLETDSGSATTRYVVGVRLLSR